LIIIYLEYLYIQEGPVSTGHSQGVCSQHELPYENTSHTQDQHYNRAIFLWITGLQSSLWSSYVCRISLWLRTGCSWEQLDLGDRKEQNNGYKLIYATNRTGAINSQVETVKCLTNKNYSFSFSINIKNCSYTSLILDNIVRISMHQTQRGIKKQYLPTTLKQRRKVVIHSPTSNKAKRSTWKILASFGLCLTQHCQIITFAFLLKNTFWECINKKREFHQCLITGLLKTCILKRCAR
jgi:hypothetical protein